MTGHVPNTSPKPFLKPIDCTSLPSKKARWPRLPKTAKPAIKEKVELATATTVEFRRAGSVRGQLEPYAVITPPVRLSEKIICDAAVDQISPFVVNKDISHSPNFSLIICRTKINVRIDDIKGELLNIFSSQ